MKLDGVRVIDLSVFLPGPHLSMMMADHGADVIKVEAPGEGDPGRHIGLAQAGHTTFFRNANRGKKSVVMNLKEPASRESLLQLCEGADVFIESFRPGVVRRLGVDYEAVAARNPRIVYASISAFGQSGPNRDLPAHDLAVFYHHSANHRIRRCKPFSPGCKIQSHIHEMTVIHLSFHGYSKDSSAPKQNRSHL